MDGSFFMPIFTVRIPWYFVVFQHHEKRIRFSIIRTDQIEGGDWQWLRTQSKHPRQLLEVR